MGYGIVFWGNLSEAKNIFLLQKKAIRIIMGMKHRESCRPAFKQLKILTLTSQYILSLMTLMANNLEYFTFNYTIHNKLNKTWKKPTCSAVTFSNVTKRSLLHECKNF
jgi:hypothetical protein